MVAGKNLRILIADDHQLVREGLHLLVTHETDWEVCATASTGREALELAQQHQPDVAVLDLSMPELSGIDLVRDFKRHLPKVELVLFSAEESEEMIEQLFAAGVKSFIAKADASDSLIAAIRAAAQHRPYFTSQTARIVFARFENKASAASHGSGEKLTPREREIIRLIAKGKSNKEVASFLGVSTRTVETHRATLMRKLGMRSTAELVRYAIRNRIIQA
jgi:two-component system response regulator NreC